MTTHDNLGGLWGLWILRHFFLIGSWHVKTIIKLFCLNISKEVGFIVVWQDFIRDSLADEHPPSTVQRITMILKSLFQRIPWTPLSPKKEYKIGLIKYVSSTSFSELNLIYIFLLKATLNRGWTAHACSCAPKMGVKNKSIQFHTIPCSQPRRVGC